MLVLIRWKLSKSPNDLGNEHCSRLNQEPSLCYNQEIVFYYPIQFEESLNIYAPEYNIYTSYKIIILFQT